MLNTVSTAAINAHSHPLLTSFVSQANGPGKNLGEELIPASSTLSGPRGPIQVIHYLRVKGKRLYTCDNSLSLSTSVGRSSSWTGSRVRTVMRR